MVIRDAWLRENADDFARAFIKQGLAAQMRIGHRLLEEGLTVKVGLWEEPEEKERGAGMAKAAELANAPDLSLGPAAVKIEVKERDIMFTNPSDFPYRTCMVGDRHSWTDLTSWPAAIIILSSQQEDAFMAVMVPYRTGSSDIPHGFELLENKDKVRGIDVTSVVAPRALYRSWNDFIAWAKAQEGI